MSETIFTKIINGDIPSHKVYEDELTYAFLDIYPITAGHTLVIPKKPVEFIWDLEAEDYQALMAAVQKIGQHIKEQLSTKYVGVKVIGTDVPHAHVHLVPFNTPGEYYRTPEQAGEPNNQELADVAAKIRL